MKVYDIKYKAIFEGVIKVRAKNREDAKEVVKLGFGGASISIGKSSWYSNDPRESGIVDWNFDITPTERIIK